jgi:hypothetical protein
LTAVQVEQPRLGLHDVRADDLEHLARHAIPKAWQGDVQAT